MATNKTDYPIDLTEKQRQVMEKISDDKKENIYSWLLLTYIYNDDAHKRQFETKFDTSSSIKQSNYRYDIELIIKMLCR
jgi:hypothetical protein